MHEKIHTFMFYISCPPGDFRPNADIKYNNWCVIVNVWYVEQDKTYTFQISQRIFS